VCNVSITRRKHNLCFFFFLFFVRPHIFKGVLKNRPRIRRYRRHYTRVWAVWTCARATVGVVVIDDDDDVRETAPRCACTVLGRLRCTCCVLPLLRNGRSTRSGTRVIRLPPAVSSGTPACTRAPRCTSPTGWDRRRRFLRIRVCLIYMLFFLSRSIRSDALGKTTVRPAPRERVEKKVRCLSCYYYYYYVFFFARII